MKTVIIILHLFSNGKAIEVSTPFVCYPNSKEDGPSIVRFNSKEYTVYENFSKVLELWKLALGETESHELKYRADRNKRDIVGIVENGNEEGVLLKVYAEEPKDMQSWVNEGPFYIVKTKALYFENDACRNEFLVHSIGDDTNEYIDSNGIIWTIIKETIQ